MSAHFHDEQESRKHMRRLGATAAFLAAAILLAPPDLTLPVASKAKLYALVNIRHLWEMGARTKTQGQSLVVTATLPIPSVKLK